MFKYEMHMHTCVASKCGIMRPREAVRFYHELGYQGMVITEHFTGGNTAIPRSLEWDKQIDAYYLSTLQAREEAKKYDMDVIFGLEQGYGKGKEVLLYNIDPQMLKQFADMPHMDYDRLCDAVHSIGGIVVHAHPYRQRSYVDPAVEPNYGKCDGIEVINMGNTLDENVAAYNAAKQNGLFMTSGTDRHKTESFLCGGMAFDNRIRTGEDLVRELKAGRCKMIYDSEPIDDFDEYMQRSRGI